MDLKALKRLSIESPFEGERTNAADALKSIRKRKQFQVDLNKPLIFFNKKFKKYRHQWFHIKYDLENHGIFEVKFIYLGLLRHENSNEFSFIVNRLKYFKDGKWIRFPIHQIIANNVNSIEINRAGNSYTMKEFLRVIGFSYKKKLSICLPD